MSKGSEDRRLLLGEEKVSGARGYQVYHLRNSIGKPIKVYEPKSGKTSISDTKLTENKTYYYKVCAWRTQGNKKVYGGFSSAIKGKL